MNLPLFHSRRRKAILSCAHGAWKNHGRLVRWGSRKPSPFVILRPVRRWGCEATRSEKQHGEGMRWKTFLTRRYRSLSLKCAKPTPLIKSIRPINCSAVDTSTAPAVWFTSAMFPEPSCRNWRIRRLRNLPNRPATTNSTGR